MHFLIEQTLLAWHTSQWNVIQLRQWRFRKGAKQLIFVECWRRSVLLRTRYTPFGNVRRNASLESLRSISLLLATVSSDKIPHEFTGCPSPREKFELRNTLLREDLESIDSYPTLGSKSSGLTEEGCVDRIICELRKLALSATIVMERRCCYLDDDASGLASEPRLWKHDLWRWLTCS